MLDTLTHEQFNEWCAFDEIEPLGNQPVCEVLAGVGLTVAASRGVSLTQRHFMPWADGEAEADEVLSPEQGAAFLRRLTGGT